MINAKWGMKVIESGLIEVVVVCRIVQACSSIGLSAFLEELPLRLQRAVLQCALYN